jgi:hypothetical protein
MPASAACTGYEHSRQERIRVLNASQPRAVHNVRGHPPAPHKWVHAHLFMHHLCEHFVELLLGDAWGPRQEIDANKEDPPGRLDALQNQE